MRKAYLVLADGTIYEGAGFGADSCKTGSLVFNTGVVGYIETLTDPRYAGQIVLQTFPLIGNYGMIEEDMLGEPRLHGYVVREWCDAPSNFRSRYDLDTYLKNKGVPGICGLDTRAITRKIRECGEMNAMICSELPRDLSEIRSFRAEGMVEKCSCKEAQVFPAQGETARRVAMIDYGAHQGMVEELARRGCEVTLLPAAATAEELLSGRFDGLMLSGGPGDPNENPFYIEQIKNLLGRLPIFGVGLGHQILALAAGGRVQKMNHGHRGGNQPVKDLRGTRTFITNQNHSYVVLADSVPGGEMIYINANDSSCEGMDYPGRNAFSVQFTPEAGSVPQDTSFLYDRFISMMGGE